MNSTYLFFFIIAAMGLTLASCNDDDELTINDCPNCVEGIDTTTIAASWNYEARFLTIDGHKKYLSLVTRRKLRFSSNVYKAS